MPAPDDQPRSGMRPWTDTQLPCAERIAALLAEMTLEEKAAQLGSAWRNSAITGITVAPGQSSPPRPATSKRARTAWATSPARSVPARPSR